MKKITRKPDLETESMRMWVESDKERKEEKKFQKENPDADVSVKIGDLMFKLNGFTKCSKDGELILIYKFKHEEKIIIYYVFKETTESLKAIEMIKAVGQLGGFDVQNFKDIADRILAQQGSIENLTKLKKKTKNEVTGTIKSNENSESKDLDRGKNE